LAFSIVVGIGIGLSRRYRLGRLCASRTHDSVSRLCSCLSLSVWLQPPVNCRGHRPGIDANHHHEHG
jgi:hypothetical protein